MIARRLLAACLAALVACGGGATTSKPVEPATPEPAPAEPKPAVADELVEPAPPAAPVDARKLAADETFTTKSGATISVSAGWSVAVDAASGRLTMIVPEGDLTMTLVELEGVADGAAAIAAAWKQIVPGFALAELQTDSAEDRDGWDATRQTVYVTPAAEQRIVLAAALRKGTVWRVFLIDGKQAALGRRGAQLGTTVESLKVAGVEKASWAGKPARPFDKARAAELDAFVAEAMALSKVPGVAIAIVQGGKVVHEKGYGVRALGKKDKVTPGTLFMTGSTGKSLSTLLMARAVDAGLFTWDTPVTELLPDFALADEATTKALTVRHTVCACTGMPRRDLEFIFEFAGVSAEQRLAAMKTWRPTTGFGETFQYSNLLVALGGYLAGHAWLPKLGLGPAFDQAMQKQIFGPLGMKSTTFDFAKVARNKDHALPHSRDAAGAMTAVTLDDERWVASVRPAGGAWSNVRDYARVLLLELGKGKLGGKQLISEAALLERRKPQVKISGELSYGMGLVVGTYKGIPIVWHDGGTAGFSSTYGWLPEHDLGWVILGNAGGAGGLVGAIHGRLMEIVFEEKPEVAADYREGVARGEQAAAEERQLLVTTPDASWLAGFAGAWRDADLGRIDVKVEGDHLVVDVGEWRFRAGEMKDRDGTRKLVAVSAPWAGVELVPDTQGGAPVLLLRDQQQTYVFRRETK